MMFTNAFPDVFEALELIMKALSMAAEKNDQVSDIYNRLLCDKDYNDKMSHIVRSSYSLIIKVADFHFSLAHAYLFSVERYWTAVLRLSVQNSWPSHRILVSYN